MFKKCVQRYKNEKGTSSEIPCSSKKRSLLITLLFLRKQFSPTLGFEVSRKLGFFQPSTSLHQGCTACIYSVLEVNKGICLNALTSSNSFLFNGESI